MTSTIERPAAEPTRRQRRPRWRLPRLALTVAVVALIGVLVLLYPSAASWVNQYQQSRQIDAYSADVEVIGPDEREQELVAARDYNKLLTGGASVTSDERIPLSEGGLGDESAYPQLLAADDNGLMARIKIPRIALDLPIYHGTSDSVLQRGIGHLEGTALPVGGADTHAVLTGHRGLAASELFTNLDQMRVGDDFTVETFGEVLTYRVVTTQVVEPDETRTLYPRRGEDLVTLVTCTPLGINSHRILVTAERVTPTPPDDIAAAGKSPEVPGFPWWAVGSAGALIAVSGYVWLAGRPRRQPK